MPNATLVNFLADVRHSASSLRQVPGFVVTVVATLGLSLGALVCTLMLAKQILLEPLPYPDPDRLYSVQGSFKDRGKVMDIHIYAYPGAVTLYNQSDLFEQVALTGYTTTKLLSHPQQPKLVANYITPEYLSLLAVPMALGRGFNEREKPGSEQTSAIISYEIWQKQFSGRQDIIGQKMTLREVSFTIVGVVAEGFSEPNFFPKEYYGADVWLPWDFYRTDAGAASDWRNFNSFLTVIGKLRPGLSPEQVTQSASAAMDKVYKAAVVPDGEEVSHSVVVRLVSFDDVVNGGSRTIAILLMAGALTLFLSAWSNISNLMLSRTAQKHRQLSIQAIVGATRRHLMLGLLAENSLLMAGVAVLAILSTYGGFLLLTAVSDNTIAWVSEVSPDGFTVLVTLLISALLALVFSLLSARSINYHELSSGIQSSGKGSGLQVSSAFRQGLITLQVGLTGVLVMATLSVLFAVTETLVRPMGMKTDDLTYLSVSYGDKAGEQKLQQTEELLRTIAQHASVESVTYSSANPTTGNRWGPVGRYRDDQNPVKTTYPVIGENYFEVVELPLLEGRTFTAVEVREQAPVAIVNRSLAEALYPNESALGKPLQDFTGAREDPATIIGIADNLTLPPTLVKNIGEEISRNYAYLPGLYSPGVGGIRLLARMKPGQTLSTTEWQQLVKQAAPAEELWRATSVDERRLQLLANEVMTLWIATALTMISLFLAAIGIYGVMSYNTELNRYELGVRMCLGANPGEITRHVIMNSLKPILLGGVLSLLLAALAYSFARQYLEEFIALAPLPLLGAAGLILLTAVLAIWLPVRPLTRHWPVFALHQRE